MSVIRKVLCVCKSIEEDLDEIVKKYRDSNLNSTVILLDFFVLIFSYELYLDFVGIFINILTARLKIKYEI